MATIDRERRRIRIRVVYYGPGLSGKTTNLQVLHRKFPQQTRGELVQLDTENERTLFFDYFPAHLGQIQGFSVQVDFFSVPGQSFYNATRSALLKQVDGLVFIADSGSDRELANRVSLDNLRDNLVARGRDLDTMPLVFQWNKRDVASPLPVARLEELFNPRGMPSFEAVATEGVGVWETHQAILRGTVSRLRDTYEIVASRAKA